MIPLAMIALSSSHCTSTMLKMDLITLTNSTSVLDLQLHFDVQMLLISASLFHLFLWSLILQFACFQLVLNCQLTQTLLLDHTLFAQLWIWIVLRSHVTVVSLLHILASWLQFVFYELFSNLNFPLEIFLAPCSIVQPMTWTVQSCHITVVSLLQ